MRKGSCWLEGTEPISVLFFEKSPQPLSFSSPESRQNPRASVFMSISRLRCFYRLIYWLQVFFFCCFPNDFAASPSLQLFEDWQTCATASKPLPLLLYILPYLVRSANVTDISDYFLRLVAAVQAYFRSVRSRSFSPCLSGSKKGWLRASVAVRRSLGSILRRPLMRERPFGHIFPKYFFQILSSECISGNFMPRNR